MPGIGRALAVMNSGVDVVFGMPCAECKKFCSSCYYLNWIEKVYQQ